MRADSVQDWGAQIMLNIKKEKDGEKFKIVLSAHKNMSRQGSMVLRGANENVMEIF